MMVFHIQGTAKAISGSWDAFFRLKDETKVNIARKISDLPFRDTNGI